MLHNAIHTIPDALRKCRADVPKDLETICLKALSKRPEDRYASCQALSDDLRRWQEGEPITARRLRLPERAARWVRKEPKLAGAFATVLLVVGLALLLISGSAQRAREAASDAEAARIDAEKDALVARAAERRAADALEQANAANTRAAQLNRDKLGALGTAEEERQKALAWQTKTEKAQEAAELERRKAETEKKDHQDLIDRLLSAAGTELRDNQLNTARVLLRPLGPKPGGPSTCDCCGRSAHSPH